MPFRCCIDEQHCPSSGLASVNMLIFDRLGVPGHSFQDVSVVICHVEKLVNDAVEVEGVVVGIMSDFDFFVDANIILDM